MLRKYTKERREELNNRRGVLMEDLKFMAMLIICVGSAIFACYQTELAGDRVEDKEYCLRQLELAPSTKTFCNKLLENYYGD